MNNIVPLLLRPAAGFRATRDFFSMTRPDGTATYTMEVLDGGEAPVFRVVADDQPPGADITHRTPGQAWGVGECARGGG